MTEKCVRLGICRRHDLECTVLKRLVTVAQMAGQHSISKKKSPADEAGDVGYLIDI